MNVGFSISLFHFKFRRYMCYEKNSVSQDIFVYYVNFLIESLQKLKIEFLSFLFKIFKIKILFQMFKDDLNFSKNLNKYFYVLAL